MSQTSRGIDASPTVAGEVFRPAVRPLFVWFNLMVVPVCSGYFLWRYGWAQGRHVLLAAGLSAVLCLIAALLCKLLFPLRITPEGVHGHSAWGLPRYIRWRDLTAVRPFRLLHLKYVRLYSRHQKHAVWIGLFLAEPEKFRAQVQAHALPDDPLAQYLNLDR